MCTYNGAPWLRAQLDSFAAQDLKDWALVVSDDGSSDDTLDILRTFAETYPVTIYEQRHGDHHLRPSQRAARNYMQTLNRPDLPVGPDTYVALSDQDDIWRADKLSHAVATLKQLKSPVALYGGQSRHIREDGTPIVFSRAPERAVGVHNALVQNVVSGHSAVLTPAALTQLRKAGAPSGIWYHDWWIYLLISAVGGHIVVDDHVGLDYRQHDTNLMGAGSGRTARRQRLHQVFNGEYGAWMRANLRALHATSADLTPQARTALSLLTPSSGPCLRLAALWRSGAYRQNPIDTLCIYIAGATHKL